jgi:hypothetical protein
MIRDLHLTIFQVGKFKLEVKGRTLEPGVGQETQTALPASVCTFHVDAFVLSFIV